MQSFFSVFVCPSHTHVHIFHPPMLPSDIQTYRDNQTLYTCPLAYFHYSLLHAVFNLEKTFKTTFALLVLHMWLCLRRLKEEGKEGVEFGQYLYEIYNHDVELRVSKAGVREKYL